MTTNLLVLCCIPIQLNRNRDTRHFVLYLNGGVMFILLPKELLVWIDSNRGELSRQSFMIQQLLLHKTSKG